MLCRRDILRSCARKMSDLFLLQIRLRSCMNFFGFNLQLLQNFLRSCRTFCALSGFSSYGMDFGLFFAASHFLVRIRICSEVRIRISKTFLSCYYKFPIGEQPESDEGTRVRVRYRKRRSRADQIRSDTSLDAKTQSQIRSDAGPFFFR